MLCPSSLWPGVGQKRQWQDRLGWFPCEGLALSFVPGGCGDWIIEMWEKHGEAITALRWPSESTTRSLVQVSGCHWFLSRKSMQIFHLLHFVALLYIYITFAEVFVCPSPSCKLQLWRPRAFRWYLQVTFCVERITAYWHIPFCCHSIATLHVASKLVWTCEGECLLEVVEESSMATC